MAFQPVFEAYRKAPRSSGYHFIHALSWSDGYGDTTVYHFRVSKEEFDTLKELQTDDPRFAPNTGGLTAVDIEKVDAQVYLDVGLPTLAMGLTVMNMLPSEIEVLPESNEIREFHSTMTQKPKLLHYSLFIQMWATI